MFEKFAEIADCCDAGGGGEAAGADCEALKDALCDCDRVDPFGGATVLCEADMSKRELVDSRSDCRDGGAVVFDWLVHHQSAVLENGTAKGCIGH